MRFAHAHIGSPEHVIVDRVASMSFVAALPPDRRARLLDDVRDLIQKTSALVQPGEVRFPYQTAAFHCVRD